MWAQQLSWRFCSRGQLSASSGAAFLMKSGKIKDLHPLTSKCFRFLAPPSALATGIISLSLVSLTLCLSLSSGTCEAYMWEWVLTSETDVTSGRAGTVTCQPLSCLRQCSLKWIRKSLIGILREITCSSARAAARIAHQKSWVTKGALGQVLCPSGSAIINCTWLQYVKWISSQTG